ncbi:MAG: 4-hydroxythreonine-4-phosphate dehydrogenase PdxA [Verrucomicrobia bacterium Tous-C9LFEB]|nr:MAG: 4-hydroxythreonine-4-phosphate dehydrogenase PdxA [Verrucomicrobia bacterium Tous-C9LFEB]
MPTPKDHSLPLIALTIGDPAGIGPEVIAKALRSGKLAKGFRYEVIGERGGIAPGRSTKKSARVALAALDEAVARWKRGELAAIVTGPIQKETMEAIGFPFPGHTEYFAHHCGVKEDDVVMMLADAKLRVALCSTHCSLLDAIQQLNVPKIIHVARTSAAFLRRIGIAKPRLALAALNPHAGEGGLFGNEEARILAPALKALRRYEKTERFTITGPHSPDTLFHRAVQGGFDAVVCLYHDQGLIPFKLIAFSTGVNISLGLPLVRTSPDHGTALDLAGKGVADASSMVEAINTAALMVRSSVTGFKTEKRGR